MNREDVLKIVADARQGERVPDLCWADLCWADLREADLHGANLHGADLREADLSKANLHGADLHGADLCWADLHGADLCGADLHGADLHGAHLCRADLCGANLHGADLHGADLHEAKWDYSTAGLADAPQGALIVWGKKGRHIVKMRVPEEARRSCATTRKFRSEYVVVLEIDDGAITEIVHESSDGPTTRYAVGEIVRADLWDEDRWNECSHGIHWFLTRHEAEMWAL